PRIPPTAVLKIHRQIQSLQEVLAWPSPQTNYTFATSTSAVNSFFKVLNKGKLHVGDTLRIAIHAMDHNNDSKRYGGDYFRFKIYSSKLKAGAFGSVRDLENGQYAGNVTLFWAGDVQIDVKLIHSSETVELLRRLRDSAPDKVYFYGYFEQSGAASERTVCNMFKPADGNMETCEYPDRATGEVWFCVKPKILSCESL
uniref:Uncharacterized protein n=1 Tax=Petromyzon marinus TaxID=7757 RepID=S4RE53_PETMA